MAKFAILFLGQIFLLKSCSAMSAAATTTGAEGIIDIVCNIKNCADEFSDCWSVPQCRKTLLCSGSCDPDDPKCVHECGLFKEDKKAVSLIECSVKYKCIPAKVVGKCLGTDDDADQQLTSLDLLIGNSWWNIRGLECGGKKGLGWDNIPCFHASISVDANNSSKIESHDKFCLGEEKNNYLCGSDYLETSNELIFVKPGVYRKKSFALSKDVPQFSRVKILALLAPDLALSSNCGQTGARRLNHLNLISSDKNRIISEEERTALKTITEKYGVDFDEMCTIDNSSCE